MAFSFASSRSGYGGRWKRPPMADINVTPLVDVMLVLLIIFMVAAPLLVAGVPIDLPQSRAKALPQDNTPVQVSLDAKGRIFVDKLQVEAGQLAPKLTAIAKARSDQPRIYVRADRSLDYGRVISVVGEINAAGLTKVALVSDMRSETLGTPVQREEPQEP